MDAATFRWALVIIALLIALGIYFYGQHQSRLRRRSAIDTFTREEIDSAFVEDEQLRTELNNLNQILRENEAEENLEDFRIDSPLEEQKTPFALPDPEIYVHQPGGEARFRALDQLSSAPWRLSPDHRRGSPGSSSNRQGSRPTPKACSSIASPMIRVMSRFVSPA